MSLFDFLHKNKHSEATRSSDAQEIQTRNSEHDFDSLVRRTQNEKTRESLDALWGAVYSMESWYMIAIGQSPHIGPFVGVVNDKPFLFAFTDPEKAVDAAKNRGVVEGNAEVHLLSIPVKGFVQAVESYIAQGVYGVLFNDGDHAFYTPLTDVASMYQHQGLDKDRVHL